MGRTIDAQDWFRKHAAASADRWKIQLYSDGAIWTETQLQMGRALTAHIGPRNSLLRIELIRTRAFELGIDKEGPFRARARKRGIKIPQQSRKHGTWYTSVFQNDLMTFAVGQNVTRKLMSMVNELFRKLKINIRTKPEETRQISTKFETVGAEYIKTNPENIISKPMSTNSRTSKPVLNVAARIVAIGGRCGEIQLS